MSNEPQFIQIKRYLSKKYNFRYNHLSNEIEYKEIKSVKFSNVNMSDLYAELKTKGFPNPKPHIDDLIKSSFVGIYDPFADYFNGLPEDDMTTPNYIANLANHIIVAEENRAEFNKHFCKMLVRCVACAKGIAFNKQAFILVGGQNGGKSTFLRFLVPPALKQYTTESFDPDDKDAIIALCQNFMINLDELADLEKKDVTKIKTLISTDTAKVRKPYASKPETMKRLANFVGSTNELEFITDTTGTVRWLCFEILGIIWGYEKTIDIDKVWAQANQMLKDGFDYKLSAEELSKNELRNNKYKKTFTELELVNHYFEVDEEKKKHNALTATDVVRILAVLEPNIKLNAVKIGVALRAIAIQESVKKDGKPIKAYFLSQIR